MVRAQRPKQPRKLTYEQIESRLCMAASVGWDGPGRGAAELTYYIGATPNDFGLNGEQVRAALQTAMNAWSAVADITFTETHTPGLSDSIDFSFGRIDGAGGTLAQAYFPDDVNPRIIAGDVQFDTSETWENGNARGNAAFDLVYVAVHELGHALGLNHSNASGSVLADRASAGQRFASLAAADVDAILALYAPARSSTPTQKTPQATPTATTPATIPTGNTPTATKPTTTAPPTTTPTLPRGFTPPTTQPTNTTTPGTNGGSTPTDNGLPNDALPRSTWSWRFTRYSGYRPPSVYDLPSWAFAATNRFLLNPRGVDIAFSRFGELYFRLNVPQTTVFVTVPRWRG